MNVQLPNKTESVKKVVGSEHDSSVSKAVAQTSQRTGQYLQKKRLW